MLHLPHTKEKQNCFPLGATMACLLFAPLARAAGMRPDAVEEAVQSPGKCPPPPHQKQCADAMRLRGAGSLVS